MKRLFDEKRVLDERELMDMYRVEHGGFWAMLVLLSAAVVVQLFLGAPLLQMAGELAVILVVSVGMIIAYARKGLWDDHSRPSVKGNAATSAACGAGVALIVAALRKSFPLGLAAGAAMFALCFALLELMMATLTRRQSREEAALSGEDEDEINS